MRGRRTLPTNHTTTQPRPRNSRKHAQGGGLVGRSLDHPGFYHHVTCMKQVFMPLMPLRQSSNAHTEKTSRLPPLYLSGYKPTQIRSSRWLQEDPMSFNRPDRVGDPSRTTTNCQVPQDPTASTSSASYHTADAVR